VAGELATDCSEAALKALETNAKQRPESAGPVETERGKNRRVGEEVGRLLILAMSLVCYDYVR
jgi:hypothetical protein